tara:strand:- start:41030 stop:42397 length:1368 start_codon:yes stop_codon:yes gene_type:complete
MNLTFPNEETIAAIATANSAGQGGIAIIRISGPLAEETGKRIVHVPGNQVWESHHILYGQVIDSQTQELIDEVLVLFMKSPRSFTGEDVVEIHCHGGLIAVQRVLKQVLLCPQTRRAFPGEFSERAVLNGRLDLTQAEAILELISARSEKAAQLAMSGISGEINKQISGLRNQLLDLLSELEARVDFEDELPPLNENQFLNEILMVRNALQALIDNSKRSAVVRHGLQISLIGLPNVGKSSVLNRLSKVDRAIVTDIPGTTRDLLEMEIILEGVPIILIDTAGIHATQDTVEKLGIEKSHQAIQSSDLVVYIFDISKGWSKDDQTLLSQIPDRVPKIIIGNKSDICISPSKIKPDIIFSALTGEGESNLVKALLNKCGASDIEPLKVTLNERQLELAILAKSSLDKTQNMASQKLPWDFWTIDLREAIHKLGELSGEEITESLLDRIFSKFCIGK